MKKMIANMTTEQIQAINAKNAVEMKKKTDATKAAHMRAAFCRRQSNILTKQGASSLTRGKFVQVKEVK